MLQIVNGIPISSDKYYIQHMENGLDELHFEVSLDDPAYFAIYEETAILETTEGQTFTVKKINAGQKTADISCQLDLRDWQQDIFFRLGQRGFLHEFTETRMLSEQIMKAQGLSAWQMVSEVRTSKTRKIEMEGPTPLEVALQMQKTFGCALRFDNREKRVRILYPTECALSKAYAVDSVNLRKVPEFKGSTAELYTRLYPTGADGLGIAAINGGKDYVDAQSPCTDRVICKLWSDARYTDAASLLADAPGKVNAAAQPERSWKLDVVDLHRIDPETWPDMGLGIFTVLHLIDSKKGIRANVQVCEDKVWPYYPEENQITVSTVTGSVQRDVRNLQRALADPNSDFWQQFAARTGG